MDVHVCFCFKIRLSVVSVVPKNRSAFLLEEADFLKFWMYISEILWVCSDMESAHAGTNHAVGRDFSASVSTKRELSSSIQDLLVWKLSPPELGHLRFSLYSSTSACAPQPHDSPKTIFLPQGSLWRCRGGYEEGFLKKTAKKNTCRRSSPPSSLNCN